MKRVIAQVKGRDITQSPSGRIFIIAETAKRKAEAGHHRTQDSFTLGNECCLDLALARYYGRNIQRYMCH